MELYYLTCLLLLGKESFFAKLFFVLYQQTFSSEVTFMLREWRLSEGQSPRRQFGAGKWCFSTRIEKNNNVPLKSPMRKELFLIVLMANRMSAQEGVFQNRNNHLKGYPRAVRTKHHPTLRTGQLNLLINLKDKFCSCVCPPYASQRQGAKIYISCTGGSLAELRVDMKISDHRVNPGESAIVTCQVRGETEPDVVFRKCVTFRLFSSFVPFCLLSCQNYYPPNQAFLILRLKLWMIPFPPPPAELPTTVGYSLCWASNFENEVRRA